jgi:serine/threonine protein kinase
MNSFLEFQPYGYQMTRKLGDNSAGGRITYQATDLNTQQPVVIKQFQFATLTSWTDYDAYEREIQVLKQLDHPNIPRYLDSVETPNGFCLIQEYKEAKSLSQDYHFSLPEIKEIAIAVLEVLVYLQQQTPPIIHRDLKPENILIQRSDPLKVYMIDFGFACQREDDTAVSSVVKGTLGFMSPEQLFNRQLTKATDLYGLGVTLICLLTKTKSSEIGNLVNNQGKFKFHQALPLGLNPKFIKWLDRMISPDLKSRYPDAQTALRELKSISILAEKTWIPVAGVAVVFGAIIINSLVNNFPYKILIPQDPTVSPDSTSIQINSNLEQLLKTGQCPGCNLTGVNLRRANLVGANLKNANLSGANLSGANLKRVILNNADLSGVNFNGADLYNADLTNANLSGANLNRSNLENAHLENANLSGANLNQANLYNTILWNTNQ